MRGDPDGQDDRDDRIPKNQRDDCTDCGAGHQSRPHAVQWPKHDFLKVTKYGAAYCLLITAY